MSGITVRSIVAKLGWDVDEGKLGRWTRKTDEAKKGLEGVDRQATKTKKSVVSMATEGLAKFDLLTNGIAKLVAPLREVISIGARREGLRTALETAEGDANKAAVAFERLNKFAADTPFQLDNVTSSYLLLKNQGLDPSTRALTAYGDIAAAMDKDITQMAEAAADAVTGEFERLKEFGIKASSQGDKVALSFKGTTTTIGKNAEEIQRYLIELGETNFAGGMERQSQTLGGLWSTLKDNAANVADEFMKAGLGEVLKEWVAEGIEAAKSTAKWIKENKDLIRVKVREFLDNVRKAAKTLWPVIEGLGKLVLKLLDGFNSVAGGTGPLIAGLYSLRTAIIAATGPWGLLAAAAVAAGLAIVGAMEDATKRTESLGRAAARIAKQGSFEATLKGKSTTELHAMRDSVRKEIAAARTIKEDVRGMSPAAIKRLERERQLDLQAALKKEKTLNEAIITRVNEGNKKRQEEEEQKRKEEAANDAAYEADAQRIADKEELRDLRRRHKKGKLSDAEIDRMRELEKVVGRYTPKGGGKKPKKEKSLLDLVTGAKAGGGESAAARGLGTTIINIDARSTIKVEVPAPDGLVGESPNANRAVASELGWNIAQELEPYFQGQIRKIAKVFEG